MTARETSASDMAAREAVAPDGPQPVDAVTAGMERQPDAREAAIRSFGTPGRAWWLLVAALSTVVLVGLAAWIYQLRNGLGVAGFNDEAFWAVDIADVVTFIGVSYGGAVVSAILRLTGAEWRAPLTRLAEGTAVVTVLVGGALIIPHLGRPARIWELVARPNLSSPIFWDFVAVSTYTAASLVFFALPLVPDMAAIRATQGDRLGRRARLYAAVSRGWTGTPAQRRVLGGALGLVSVMIIPLAVSVHSVLSWAFALVTRPWWHESIWAPYFVVAALYSGVALVILVLAAFRRGYRLHAFITDRHFIRLGFILAAFAAAYLYLTLADILPGAYAGERDTATVFQALLVGRYAPWFWIFVVAGGIVPLLLVALPRTRTVPGMVTACALVVPAMWLKRVIMVVAPANYDRVSGAFGAYHFTWVSISITLAALAAVPLLLMLLFRVVPLLSIDEIEHEQADGTPAPQTVEPGPAERPHRPGGARLSRATRTTAVLLVLLAGLSLHAASSAHAQATKPTLPAGRITLTADGGGTAIQLTATLTDSGGIPMPAAPVQFFERITEFGPKGQLVPLGAATSDAQGVARLTYTPVVTGPASFVAKYDGGPTVGPTTSAPQEVTVTTARAAYRPAPAKPLATAGKTAVAVLLSIVAAIWLTLAAQVARIRRACRTQARPAAPAP